LGFRRDESVETDKEISYRTLKCRGRHKMTST
jgi:hypothetical protein